MPMTTTRIAPPELTPAGSRPPLPPQEDLALVAMLQRLSRVLRGALSPLRRHRLLVFGTAIAAAAIGVGLSFLVAVEYRSKATFFVDRASRTMGLPSGLASIGRSLGVGGEDDGQSPDFYGWLATSDDVLSVVLRDTVPTRLRMAERPGPTAWEQLFDRPVPPDSVAWSKGLSTFKEKVAASVNLTNGTIVISAPGPTRELSMWVAGRVFESMNDINTTRRRTRAGNELRFLRGQRADADAALRGAEARLTAFLSNNRQAVLPPTLRFEEDQLRRRVDVGRDVFIGLSRSVQEAELRAVRDVPALSLIEGPTYPVRKSKPRRLVIGIVAGLLGFAAAYAFAWWRLALAPADERA
jgi:hypothetical protein